MQVVQALSFANARVLLVIAAFLFAMPATDVLAAAKRKPSVLMVYSLFDRPWRFDVQSKLLSSGQFRSVDFFDASAVAPALADLLPYDAVLLFNDNPFFTPAVLGDNLADYVDAGGGVVTMALATTTTGPAGRWNPGYLCVVPGASTVANPQVLDLASIANQNHPMLIGVGSFNGGTSSFRANQNSVVSGASVVARWSGGGNVLAATGPLPGRADLNFFPVSNAVRSDLWNPTSDGIKLMANTLLYVMRPRVFIAGSPSIPAWNNDVKATIRASGLVGITEIFDIASATPTLEHLKSYDAALVYTEASASNAVALGNVLADFVDSGGGVVKAMNATAGTDLQGRWVSETYDLITTPTSITGGEAILGAVTYPTHPALASTTSFSGGVLSLRASGSSLNPRAFSIAQWSDGKPLIVASTKFSNRADLNFFPPSSAVNPNFWTGDGGRLMANALVYTCKPYIACVIADPVYGPDPIAKLLATRRFSGVEFVTAQFSTPSASTLRPFNALFTWNWEQFSDRATLGNNLADFVDAGGGVVVTMFANVNVSNPLGRWASSGYEIVPSPPAAYLVQPQKALGAVLEPANPVNTFVRKFSGGLSYRFTTIPPLRGRAVLQWSDGTTLAAVHNYLKRVDLGFYPASNGSSFSFGGGWNQRTDGTWLMANAAEYTVYRKPCPGDFNADGFVDDADFVLFAGWYDELLTARGDLNGDGVTDDPDFVRFSGAYDQLLCP